VVSRSSDAFVAQKNGIRTVVYFAVVEFVGLVAVCLGERVVTYLKDNIVVCSVETVA
jgi:hypothetical protein